MRSSAFWRRSTQRERTGKGCHVDAALVDSTVGVLANQALNFLVSGDVPKRIGNTHPNIVPYQVFEASDGYIIVATGNDRQYQQFCGVLGAPELGDRPGLSHQQGSARQARRTDRQAFAAGEDDEARRPAGEARSRAPFRPVRSIIWRRCSTIRR